MRLTLRTLLAYLDDILDPADKEELAKKIETSEFAEDLVHRTRDAMRRLRLSAPQVVGTGMGLDPNTVAEYLDNVLPPQSVGDFERICLESDVHLGEAAACHHVLTMVLGEPADVDPRARQRMYGIPAEAESYKRRRVEGAHVRAAAVPLAAAPLPVAIAPVDSSYQPTRAGEIPEYLRTSMWTRYRAVLLALAATLFVAATVYLVSGLQGWFGSPPPVTALNNSENTAAGLNGPAAPAAASTAVGDRYAVSSPVAPSLASPPQPLTPGIGPAAAPPTSSVPDRYAVPPTGAVPPNDVPAVDPAAAGGAATLGATPPSPYDVAPPSDPSAIVPPAGDAPRYPGLPADSAVVVGEPTESEMDARAGETADVTSGATAVEAATEPGTDTNVSAEEEVPAGPPELGTYLGSKTVLLRYDDRAGGWFRVQPRDPVIAGQRLLALPEFRPKITLTSGVHLDVSGETQLRLGVAGDVPAEGLPAAGDDTPAIEVVYGRIVLINTSNAENQVRLTLGPSVVDTRLARNATLAIEVEPKHVPGRDPRQSPAPVVARLFAPDGGVEWQDAAGTRTIENPSRWTIQDGMTSAVAADPAPPEWIDQEPVGQLSEQRYGAPVVEGALVSDRPADIQLLELFQGSGRTEVKSLVARSSIHVGLFEPFIDALRDSAQKANWWKHIETLRKAMALSPESAKKVSQTLIAQRQRPAADDLFEMLCGYNEDQIGRTAAQMKTGAVARLIDWLEEDSLDYRVLAVHDLKEITGRQLMSNPAANLAERKQNIRRWRLRLEAGELSPASAE